VAIASFEIYEFEQETSSILANELVMYDKAASRLNGLFVEKLYEAVASPDRLRAKKVVATMLESGIGPCQIADDYIPRVAELLGEAWCRDNIDFAVTTIGSARLQGLLRSLGPEWCADDTFLPRSVPRFCVIVPEHGQHTLGASILAGQLRRRKISVDLEIGRSIDALEGQLSLNRYDAVLISASAREGLVAVRNIVDLVRNTDQSIPVLVGGGLLTLSDDIQNLTGADFVTSNLDDAIAFCNKSVPNLRLVINK